MDTTRASKGLRWMAPGVVLAGWWVLLPVIAGSVVAEPVDARAQASQGPGGARSAAQQWRRLQQPPRAHQVPQGVLGWRGVMRPRQWRQGQRIVEGDISVGAPPKPGEIEPEGLGTAHSTARRRWR